MSGRYALFRWPPEVTRMTGFPADYQPRWNISPHAQVLFMRHHEGECRVDSGRWGLTPAWFTDLSRTPTHARAETVADQPMFREAFAQRRCLLLANGFYEWRGTSRKRAFWMINGEPLAFFAGIWEAYPVMGQVYLSVAMLTQPAGGLRRPLVLAEAERDAWLSSTTEPRVLNEILLKPSMPLRERVLAGIVNDPSVDGPECLTPL
ncbi:SOS response-associated peptidase [Pseudomonas luteola]|uniref:SOS response-associated peptidase n=1 Tax=Pseudomonas TaxID=286 RepID=UPI003DA0C9A0